MNFSFLSSDHGLCQVKLWATGRYGFSLPKKVEITVPCGDMFAYVYYNQRAGFGPELTNRAIVRIAIGQFLAGQRDAAQAVGLDQAAEPYAGGLTQVASRAGRPPALLRVRPGKGHARNWADPVAGSTGKAGE